MEMEQYFMLKHPFVHPHTLIPSCQDTVTGLCTWVAPMLPMATAVGSLLWPTVTSTPGNKLAAMTGDIQDNL